MTEELERFQCLEQESIGDVEYTPSPQKIDLIQTLQKKRRKSSNKASRNMRLRLALCPSENLPVSVATVPATVCHFNRSTRRLEFH